MTHNVTPRWNDTQVRVYQALYSMAEHTPHHPTDGVVTGQSLARIADASNVSLRSAQRAVRALEARGPIHVSPILLGGRSMGHVYHLPDLDMRAL